MGTRAAREARRDPLPVVVSVVALVVCVLHGFDGWLTRDQALYVYAGQRFADGIPPYEAVLNRAGPLAHMLPGAGVLGTRLLGVDDVYGLRVLFLLFSVATVAAVYLLGRDLWRSRWVGVATAAAFLSFVGFIHYATNGPSGKTTMTLFLVLSLWSMVRRRWFAAGLHLSLATLFLQIVFFVGMPALLVAALWHARRVRALALVTAGGLVPVAVLGVYFAAVGALRDAVDGFLLINVRYTTAQPFTEDLATHWDGIVDSYGPSVVVLLVGPLAVAGFAVASLRQGRAADSLPDRADLAALVAGTLLGVWWTSRDFDGWPDLFPFLPIAAVGVGGLVGLALRGRTPRVRAALTLGWTAAAVVFAAGWAVSAREHFLPSQRAAVDAAVELADGRPQFVTFNAPQALVLSGTRSPSRYLIFGSGTDEYVGDEWPGGVDSFGADMVARRPDAIAVGEPGRQWIERALDGRYERVAEAPDWVWYLPRPVTAAERAALEGRRSAQR